MAITFYDGFENYSNRSQLTQGRWLNAGLGVIVRDNDGATGSQCLELGEIASARAYAGAASANIACGFHVKLESIPRSSAHRQLLHRFRDSQGRDIFGLMVTNTGRLALRATNHESPLLGISKSPIPAMSWTHIEVVVTGGAAKVYINGRLEIEASQAVSWDAPSQVCFGYDTTGVSGGVTFWLDDVVAQTGAVQHLGITGVHYLWPIEDRLPQDWQPTTGSAAYALINEPHPDDDVKYIFADAAGDKSMFGTTSLPSNVTEVLAVAPLARMRKSDMGDTSVGLGVLSGTSEAVGDDLPLHPNYVYQTSIFEIDPDTSERWSPLNMPHIFVTRNT